MSSILANFLYSDKPFTTPLKTRCTAILGATKATNRITKL